MGKRLTQAAHSRRSWSSERIRSRILELHAYRKTPPLDCLGHRAVLGHGCLRRIQYEWRGRTIGSITKRDVIDLVEGVAVSGRPGKPVQ
jgi:hypothetical protein